MSGADVHLEEPSATIEAVATSVTAFLSEVTSGPPLEPVLLTAVADFTAAFGDSPGGHLAPAVHGFFSNGGQRCYVVNVGAPGAEGDERAARFAAGLKALDTSDVALVVLPGVTDPRIQDAVLAHCEQRRDRFAILDAPDGTAVDETPARPRESTYGACYHPWIQVYEPGQGNVWVPPSGHVAGVYARVDQERGVQVAPANEVLRGALALRHEVSKKERERLDAHGVNCIMTIQHGIRIWGARTLGADPMFRDVPTRRLAILVEASITRGIGKVDARLVPRITSFLTRLHRDGALLGDAAEEAFYVKLDEAAAAIEIGVAVVRAGEFFEFKTSGKVRPTQAG
jgi:phage tail sheath protein FI